MTKRELIQKVPQLRDDELVSLAKLYTDTGQSNRLKVVEEEQAERRSK